ncbi:hypothetical protein Ahy_A08g038980 [Arachis hypogaea]|uniref:Ubiquitin-like protease family profile domain-containing protein n=1 Tax=Arachis hypogaea TaxID=3818 RepID=A0A445BV89_ARAHY|nr:hypothetical protein Ahy_A08g038980 [Arachis hypogaea]
MSSRSNPAPEDVDALMMMARTTSYIPKEGPMPSFSFGLTDSSQEEAATGVKTTLDYAEDKSPQIEKQSGEESFEKFETPLKSNEISAEMKEKCYLWATGVKTYGNGSTNEYDAVCTLKAQDRFILSKIHFVSLKADTHIEAENMAIGNHSGGEFLQPKTPKPFRVKVYPMFIPFLNLKKLASHQYIFAPICYSEHWWLWVADVRNKKFYILDPYHKTCPSEGRMKPNKFVDEVGHFRVEYAFRILFHEMNQDRVEAIRGSDVIRLSKPSLLLLSPYCQIDSNDIDTD